MFAIVAFAAATILSGFVLLDSQFSVDGKLVVHGHEKRKCTFEVLVKGDDKLLAASKVDSTGHFKLNFVSTNEKAFDFFYIDSHHAADTIFLKSFAAFDRDELELTFYTFKGVVAVDEDDRVICPKCERSGYTRPVPGLPGYYYCSADKIKF
jgi:hypothetical protein